MEYYEHFKTETELINNLFEYINKKKQIIISKEEVQNLYYSLKTQRLVILNSNPGMGKTELAKSFVEFFKTSFREGVVKELFIPIDKDFDKTDLLGYRGLDGKYNPSQFAKDVLKYDSSEKHTDENGIQIFFVILDEMNLNHIDFYFSKLLSAIENDEEIELPNMERVRLPKNIFFIGTINSFTNENSRTPLSGSVKRRCNIINVKNPLEKILSIPDSLERKSEFAKIMDKIVMQSRNKFETVYDIYYSYRQINFNRFQDKKEFVYELLYELTESLIKSKNNMITIGVLQDIIEYIIFSNFENNKTALDIQIVQKILPMFSGLYSELEYFEVFLEKHSLDKSISVLMDMKATATKNMGYITPLC